ncbi:MAG: alpha-amylase family glycosyl hydrolase [bacterium]|nr:alpha-amylase family glycosyl hydrolase [bacterium]
MDIYNYFLDDVDSINISTPKWIRYTKNKNIIKLYAQKKGLGVITLKSKDSKKEILALARQNVAIPVEFIYDGAGKEVYLAGSFNGWNSKRDKMEYKNGRFIKTLELKPGVYSYKFVVDGRWLKDEKNPLTEPDGFGGFNSVIQVGSVERPKINTKSLDISEDKIKIVIESDADEIFCVRNFECIKMVKTGNVFTVEFERSSFDNISLVASKDAVALEFMSFPIYKEGFDMRDAVIYMLFVDRFFNGDRRNDFKTGAKNLLKWAEWHGGDFKGLKQKILEGYFEKLGVDVLWLNPIYDNPDGAIGDRTYFHGYALISSTQVENHYGTMDDFLDIIEVMKKKNIKLILDMVYNHTHVEHPLYKEKSHWYSPILLSDGRKNIQLFDERPLDTAFGEDVPNIDYKKNPDAIDFQIENTLYWLNLTDAAGFRLDAVKHIEDEFWYKFCRQINRYWLQMGKKVFLIGETISDIDTINKYLKPGLLDSQFDFPLYWAIRDSFAWDRSFKRLEAALRKSNENPKISGKIIGNHDFPRFVSYAEDLREGMNHWQITFSKNLKVKNTLTYEKLKMAFGFLLTINGIPVIYYGDEIGMPGGVDPDNRRAMSFKPNKNEKAVFDFVSKMIYLRKMHMAFRYGNYKTIEVSDDTYIYEKEFFGEKFLILLTRKELDNRFGKAIIASRKFKEKIPAYTFAVFRL